jgi:ATP-binding protein involved in chromosome partitioning
VGAAQDAGPGLEAIALVRSRIRERLVEVDRIVAVMSGKGGVGKSVVAVNLALALARRGIRSALLDADLNSPSVARMLGLHGQPLRATASGLRPAPGPLGVAVQSMDFFLQGSQPLAWDGPAGEGAPLRSALEDAALGDLLGETEWGARDALVIDLPPGPDRLPALVHLLPGLTGAVAVTIPTQVSLLAVERSIRRAREARVPLIGLVENMGSAVCPRCGTEGPLFQEGHVESVARDLALPLVARVPFDPDLAAAADEGRVFLAETARDAPAARAFDALAGKVMAFEAEADSW